VATAITLLMMAGIVTLFASVSESVSRGQATMEMMDHVRATQHRLQTDLKYVTARMVPPLDPRDELGYFEIVEGPGPYAITRAGIRPVNDDKPPRPAAGDPWPSPGDDTTVGDNDDILMFTARSYGEPFIGRWAVSDAIQSQVAEICWFLRGTTLYRRVLLVTPERPIPTDFYRGSVPNSSAPPYTGMYYFADVSVHQEGGAPEPNANWGSQRLVSNSLGDLTKRENRYGHVPRHNGNALEGYPHDVRFGGQLGLPTLRESSHQAWPFPYHGSPPTNPFAGISSVTQNDFWVTPHPWANVDPETGAIAAYTNTSTPGDPQNRNPERIAEDVVLTNVLSFDVKVWDAFAPVLRDTTNNAVLEPGDPGYAAVLRSLASTTAFQDWVNRQPGATMPLTIVRLGAYVDLYYTRPIAISGPAAAATAAARVSAFSGPGNPKSQLHASSTSAAAIWDSGCTSYESDGVDQDNNGRVDDANDGLDSNGGGGVDDATERETAPPYDTPIRSIQIKLRVFERDSRQIREVTVTQDFVP
jgi:hypothetical protein